MYERPPLEFLSRQAWRVRRSFVSKNFIDVQPSIVFENLGISLHFHWPATDKGFGKHLILRGEAFTALLVIANLKVANPACSIYIDLEACNTCQGTSLKSSQEESSYVGVFRMISHMRQTIKVIEIDCLITPKKVEAEVGKEIAKEILVKADVRSLKQLC
ncbi:hypothetical protein R1flu_006297 [Riccia fluitans]|uniref:Uncharacterized protein n=1 Tax=Riccia fluitans TaxID=41844 RepID=A0ABD1YVM1_9MARC